MNEKGLISSRIFSFFFYTNIHSRLHVILHVAMIWTWHLREANQYKDCKNTIFEMISLLRKW